jgi:UvrD-like helicase C-terminal domain
VVAPFGDVGYIDGVDGSAGELVASFDGRSVTYGFGELDMLVPAYAATIQKSQGSDYPAVVIRVMRQHYTMLQRNLLYTGVTRGKRLVVLVGQKKAVAIAVRNVSGRRRWSKLGEWLALGNVSTSRPLFGSCGSAQSCGLGQVGREWPHTELAAPGIHRAGTPDQAGQSLWLDAGEPDHLAPFFCFVGDEPAECGGRSRQRHVQAPRVSVGPAEKSPVRGQRAVPAASGRPRRP